MSLPRAATHRPPLTVSILALAVVLATSPLSLVGKAVAQEAALDLGITMTDEPDPVHVGEDLTYTLRVTNHGANTSANATLLDELPASVTFLSVEHEPQNASCAMEGARVVRCALSPLPPGASFDLKVIVRPDEPGTILSRANVTMEGDAVAANDEVTQETSVREAPKLLLTMDDAPDPVALGGNLSHRLELTNGLGGPSGDLWLNATLPGGLTLVGWTTDHGECAAAEGSLACHLGELAANATARVVLWGTPTRAGTLEARATAEVAGCAQGLLPLLPPGACRAHAAEETLVLEAEVVEPTVDLALTKEGPSGPVGMDESFAYVLTVRNVGDAPSSAAVLRDLLPLEVSLDGYEAEDASTAGACTLSEAERALVCDVAPLQPGATARFVVHVTPLATGVARNHASVEMSEGADADPANNVAELETTIVEEEGPFPAPGNIACRTGEVGNSIDWPPVTGATGYRVYREIAGGGFTLLVETGPATTSHLDMKVEEGAQHAYRVTALGPGGESEASPVCELTGIPFFPILLGAAVAVLGAAGAYALYQRRRGP